MPRIIRLAFFFDGDGGTLGIEDLQALMKKDDSVGTAINYQRFFGPIQLVLEVDKDYG